MRRALLLSLALPLLLGAGQPIDPHHLAWDAVSGAGSYEAEQCWDGACVTATTIGTTVAITPRAGSAYSARVRALPPIGSEIEASAWAALVGSWPASGPAVGAAPVASADRAPGALPGSGTVMADPVFGALGTASETGSTAVYSQSSTLTGISAGDLVVALMSRDSQDDCTGVTLQGSALTLLKRDNLDYGGGTYGFDLWAGLAPSSYASATIQASYSTNRPWGSMISARYAGVASITPLASSCNATACNAQAAASTTRTSQQITTTQRALILAVGIDGNTYNTHAGANGYTVRADGSGSPVTSFIFFADKVADAGNFGGSANFTTATSDSYFALLVALEPSSGGPTSLVPADALHAQTVDTAGALSQGYTATLADALHAQTADAAGTLTQAQVLAGSAAADHAQTADPLSLVESGSLAPADALHAQTADAAGALTQAQVLAGTAAADHAQTADPLALVEAGSLAPAAVLHAQTAAAAGTLTQAHLLALADTLHGHGADAVVLTSGLSLAPAAALHTQGAEALGLIQAHLLAIADTAQVQTVESPALGAAYSLILAAAAQAQSADGLLALSSAMGLALADAAQAHAAGAVDLSAHLILVVSDTLHAQLAGAAVDATETPVGRVFIVSAESRIFAVAAESSMFQTFAER